MESEVGQGGGQKRLFTRMIASIIDNATGQVVGGQYEWNTGEKRLYWDAAPIADHALRPCENISPWPSFYTH